MTSSLVRPASSHERRIVETLTGERNGMTADDIWIAIMSPLSPDVFRQILQILVAEKTVAKIGTRYFPPFRNR